MNTRTMTWLVLAACLSSTAGAEEPAPNAALRYWQAIGAMTEYKDDARKQLDAWSTLDVDKAREMAAGAAGPLRLMQRGAAIKSADWGLDYQAEGPNLLLTHLSRVRDLAKLAMLGFRAAMAEKRYDDAVALAGSTLRMARHIGNNELLICELVEYSIEAMVVETLAAATPSLPPDQASRLATLLESVPARSSIAAGMRTEKQALVGWMERQLEQGAGHVIGQTLQQVTPLDGKPITTENKPLDATAAAAMKQMVAGLARDYDEMIRIAALPHGEFETQAKAMESRVASSLNPLTRMLLPAITGARATEFKAEARWAMLQAALAHQAGAANALSAARDPFGEGAFERLEAPGGYELRSKLADRGGKVVTLRVGRSEK